MSVAIVTINLRWQSGGNRQILLLARELIRRELALADVMLASAFEGHACYGLGYP